MRTYTPAFFIKRFTKIPPSKWTTGRYDSGDGVKCALGHCGDTGYNSCLMGTALLSFKPLFTDIIDINDGPTKDFPQKTPRGRILAALRSLPKNAKVRI